MLLFIRKGISMQFWYYPILCSYFLHVIQIKSLLTTRILVESFQLDPA